MVSHLPVSKLACFRFLSRLLRPGGVAPISASKLSYIRAPARRRQLLKRCCQGLKERYHQGSMDVLERFALKLEETWTGFRENCKHVEGTSKRHYHFEEGFTVRCF